MMERKLNDAALDAYSTDFTQRLLAAAYANRARLSGQEILSVSPVKQVNLFIINGLFEQWQLETENLKSPYFDYAEEEVARALEDFMNVLSQHISVGQEALAPLAARATHDALLLTLSPLDYFHAQIMQHPEPEWSPEDWQRTTKYVKIHRPLVEGFTERLAEQSALPKEEAAQLLREVYQQRRDDLENPALYLRPFSEVLPVARETLYEKEAEAPVSSYQPKAEVSESAASPYQPNEEESEAPAPSYQPREEAPESTATSYQLKSEETSPPEAAANTSKASAMPKTLNDLLSNGAPGATLADVHERQKINNLKSYIGVNQRFMFIRELFGNDADAYNRALETLEGQNTYVEAFNYIRNQYAQQYRWKMDSEEVVEFLEIMAKRF